MCQQGGGICVSAGVNYLVINLNLLDHGGFDDQTIFAKKCSTI